MSLDKSMADGIIRHSSNVAAALDSFRFKKEFSDSDLLNTAATEKDTLNMLPSIAELTPEQKEKVVRLKHWFKEFEMTIKEGRR